MVRFCPKCGRDTERYPARPNAQHPGRTAGDCKECHKAYAAKQYAANREREIARAVAWNRAHRERAREQVAQWARKNPARGAAKVAVRRARKLKQTCGCCTSEQIAAFYERAHEQNREVDHKLALALGGPHCLKNLEALTPADHKFKTVNWDAPLIASERRRVRIRAA